MKTFHVSQVFESNHRIVLGPTLKIKNKLCALPFSSLMTGSALSGFLRVLKVTCTPTHVLSDSEGYPI